MSTPNSLTKNLITLNQIIESLNQAIDVRQALDFALTRLVELMKLETGWIFLTDSSAQNRWAGKGYVLAAHHNLPPAMGVRRARAWKGECECQGLCHKGQLTEGYNEVQCSRLRNAPGDRHGLVVHASAPLRSGDNILGILNVAGPDWDSFSEEALVLLANVGSQMGIALERARLFDMLQEQRIHEQSLLLDLSNQLLSRSNLDDLMSFLAEEVPRLLNVDACAILLPGEDPHYLDFLAASGWYNDPVAAGHRVPADERSGSGWVMQAQEFLLVEDFKASDPTPWTAQWFSEEDFRGQVIIPLVADGQSIGTFLITNREPLLLDEDRLGFLHLIANQAAIAIEEARLHREDIKRQRLEDELSVGQQIQLSLLPETCPEVEGWEFAATYQPARLVGGDFYDFFELAGDPNQLGLVIADVAGKGVPAALFMALSRSLIRTKSMSGRHPAGVLTRANRLIYKDSRSNLFLTACYASLDLRTGWLAYSNAGHNWPLWLHAKTGEIEELNAHGTIMGAFEHIELEEREIDMVPGDLIVFYTDGITEAFNANNEMFSESRLQTAVAAQVQASAHEVLVAILEAVNTFAGDTPQSDDMTLFVIKRTK
jgi:sigma-B regulation protein RsbU (phosphoserine phosphatase)